MKEKEVVEEEKEEDEAVSMRVQVHSHIVKSEAIIE